MNTPSFAGNTFDPLGTMLPVKEESPADAGMADALSSAMSRESTQLTQHPKHEGNVMREQPSSDTSAPQRPTHPFANVDARGHRTLVIVNDEHDERPAPEVIDERAHQHAHENPNPRSYQGSEQHYAHGSLYTAQYQEQHEEQFERAPAHVPGQAYDAVHEAAYDVAHGRTNEHAHENQQDSQEHARRSSTETRHPRRIPPLVVFERFAATMSDAPMGQAPKTRHAEVPDHRAGSASYDAMDVDTPEPTGALCDSTPILSSSPSTRESIAGDSSEPSASSSAPSSTSPPAHIPSEGESAKDTIAARRPFRTSRLSKSAVQSVQSTLTRATRQAVKSTANSPTKSATKSSIHLPTKTAAKVLSKSSLRRASASIERRATRLSGIQPDNVLPHSPLNKRKRRVSERDALANVPRELRRLQDTKEFAHVDDKPVIYTVWSNGRYVPADANGEPLPDKTKTTKTAKDGQKGDSAKPADSEQEGTPTEAPKPALKRVKKWLSKGLYAGQPMPSNHAAGLTTAEKKALAKLPELATPYPRNKTLPMPIFNGLRMLIQGRDFKMPYDVFHPLPPGQPKPVKYGKMSKNRFVGEAHAIWKKSPNYDDFQSKCVCKPETGCDEDCQNRIMLYECNDSICNVGADRCSNREFQRLAERTASKNPYHIGVEVFKTPNRGHGIRASRSFQPGQIIMEYIGEIITEEESDRRMNELYKDNECYYLMSFDQSLIIDGTSGSVARFVNHSCSPNCRMIKWIVSGQPRIALFAGDRPIMSGEELTYDYNFDPYSSKNVQRCLCGSENCRGVLGPRKSEKMTKAAAAEKAAAEAAAAAKEKAKMALGKRKRDAEETADSSNSAKKTRTTDFSSRIRGRPSLSSAASKVTTTKAALEALAAEAAKKARAAKAANTKKAKRAAAKAAEAAKAEKAEKATKATAKAAMLAKKGTASTAANRVFKTTSKKTKVVFTKKTATTAASSNAAKSAKTVKGTKNAAASRVVTAKKQAAIAPAVKRTKATATAVGKPTAAKTKRMTGASKVQKDLKTTQKRGPKAKMASDVLRTATPPILEPIVNEARSSATHATPMAKALAAKAAKRAADVAEVVKPKPTKLAKVAKGGIVKPIRATVPVAQKSPHPVLKKTAQSPTKPAVAAAAQTPPGAPVKRGRGRPRLTPEDLAKRAAKATAKAAKIAETKAKAAAAKASKNKTNSLTITTATADTVDTPMADVSVGEEQELALQFLNDTAIVAKSSLTKMATAVQPPSSPVSGTGEAPRRKRGRPRKVVVEVTPTDDSSTAMDVDTTISTAA